MSYQDDFRERWRPHFESESWWTMQADGCAIQGAARGEASPVTVS